MDIIKPIWWGYLGQRPWSTRRFELFRSFLPMILVSWVQDFNFWFSFSDFLIPDFFRRISSPYLSWVDTAYRGRPERAAVTPRTEPGSSWRPSPRLHSVRWTTSEPESHDFPPKPVKHETKWRHRFSMKVSCKVSDHEIRCPSHFYLKVRRSIQSKLLRFFYSFSVFFYFVFSFSEKISLKIDFFRNWFFSK